MSHDPIKATHYIRLLDTARCEGDWDAVPELVRKVRKHAPSRTCLTLTAECEHAITQASKDRPASPHVPKSRPSTATNPSAEPIASYIPQLLDAIEKEKSHVEDDFQAQVCLGWLHWYLGEPALAASRLPRSIEEDFAQLDGTNKESSQWTKVCALKASYIKGSSQTRTGAVAEAIETFESGLPILTRVSAPAKNGKEFTSWTELFLTAFCMTSSYAIKSKISSVLETETLTAFRAWANFWDSQTSVSTGGRAPNAAVPRRHVWREYYISLSDLLQQELPYPTTALVPTYAQSSTRFLQRAELKGVETTYETLLLNEVAFPQAEEPSEEVESFVEFVMGNWRVLCGNTWKEQDLGEGGSEAVSRSVLDILYRAATKTFHSTAILRHLFTVHLAVAEFDLAFKAFDTYLEIVKKGKARVEKTKEPEHGLDDDETVLKTASECIRALCRYGSSQGAEKAKDLGIYFEEWLERHHPSQASLDEPKETGRIENGDVPDHGTKIPPRTFAMAWRCIGIGHAQWARVTFDAAYRGEIQLRAIKCFRKALSPEYDSTSDVETLFALGVVLAERRELAAAIEVVKAALLPPKPTSFSTTRSLGPYSGRFARERSLIPLWHLLAILLSARQEFTTAARACEGAFEQFQDPRNLFGVGDLNETYRSDHLNEKPSSQTQGVVDDMTDFEKDNVLEVKMTQLALIEVLEGPDVAVNASDELLSLYTRLFGDPERDLATSLGQKSEPPPKSSAGTIRTITGSIFGRPGRHRSTRASQNTSSIASDNTILPIRPQTTASTLAPTIHVTNEKGEHGSAAKKHLHGLIKDHHPVPHEGKLERSESLSRKKSSASKRTRSASASAGKARSRSLGRTTVGGEKFFTPPSDTENQEEWPGEETRPGQAGVAIASDSSSPKSVKHSQKPLPPKTQNMPQKQKELRSAHPDPAVAQDSRLPSIPHYSSSTSPVIRFSRDQERRRRTGVLIKVWLLIAGFYRRAAMYEDARGAIEEASKLIRSLEEDVSSDTTGSVSIEHAGWGGGKSISELWGDVFSERGYLALAESSPYGALQNFEFALTHFADHPSAIVGLSNILLDIYSEVLQPPPAIPEVDLPGPIATPSASVTKTNLSKTSASNTLTNVRSSPDLPSSTIPFTLGPLGFASTPATTIAATPISPFSSSSPSSASHETAQLDRLAARDRAYGLLSTLTKLGTGWNDSEAWFALARAYEEGVQVEKAKSVLWWCVELEEGRGVRSYEVVGGYVL